MGQHNSHLFSNQDEYILLKGKGLNRQRCSLQVLWTFEGEFLGLEPLFNFDACLVKKSLDVLGTWVDLVDRANDRLWSAHILAHKCVGLRGVSGIVDLLNAHIGSACTGTLSIYETSFASTSTTTTAFINDRMTWRVFRQISPTNLQFGQVKILLCNEIGTFTGFPLKCARCRRCTCFKFLSVLIPPCRHISFFWSIY